MAKQGFQLMGNNPYVYQESDGGGSSASGWNNTSQLFNIHALAVPGAQPTGTAHISIDPSINGNITLTPNGLGKVNFASVGLGVVLADTNGGLVSSGAGTLGQLMTSNGAAVEPSWYTLESTDGSIAIAYPGGNFINIRAVGVGSGSATFHTDNAVDAVVVGAAITIAGGSNITTAGSNPGPAGKVTINLSSSPSVSGSLTSVTDITTSTGNVVATSGNVIVGTSAPIMQSNQVEFQKSRSSGIITSGDWLGNVAFYGHDGSGYTIGAQILGTTYGTIGASQIPTQLEFWTHPNSVTAVTQRMVIAGDGEVIINAPDAGTALTIANNGLSILGGTVTFQPLNTSGMVTNTSAGVIGTTATTQYAVQVGNASGQLSSLTVGTTGVILQGNTTANPSWSTATYPSDAAQGDILYGSTIHVISALAKNTSATRYLANTGTSNAPQWDQVNLSNGVTSTLAVGSGGTGQTTLTVHGVLLGNATSAINTMSAGTAGQIITSSGALVDPAWTTATYPATIAKGEVLCATDANVIGVVSGTGNLGYVLTSGGAATAPTWQAPAATGIATLDGNSGSATGSTVTISGGTNLTSVAATSTVTLNLDAAITGMTSIDMANGGRVGTALVSGNTYILSAYKVGTTTYVPFITLTADTTVPTCNLDTTVTINNAYIYRAGGTDVAVADGGTGQSTLTVHGILLGNATSAIGATTAGSAGQIITSSGALADPTWTTATYPATIAKGVIVVGTDTNIVGALGSTGSAGQHLTSGGAATVPGWSTSTYADTFGAGVIVVATASNTIGALGSTGSAGQLLTSGGAATVPGWTTTTWPSSGIATGDIIAATGTNAIGVIAGTSATSGYVLTGNGSGNAATWQALPSGGLAWSVITSDLNPMVINNGYICNKAGLLTLTLPSTCAVGKTMRVTGMNTNIGWHIAQSANQIIHFGSSTTTTGVTGYLESTQMHDSVELVCIVTNLEFVVVSSTGNITIS